MQGAEREWVAAHKRDRAKEGEKQRTDRKKVIERDAEGRRARGRAVFTEVATRCPIRRALKTGT
jgi:hypothetical protein